MKPALVAFLALAACAPKAGQSDIRMIAAPPREANCKLEMLQVDITEYTFNQKWEVLGYVNLADNASQDPFAENNKKLVRPRACAMGGTVVAIAANASASDRFNQQGSIISYMVLRPKTWAQGPQAF